MAEPASLLSLLTSGNVCVANIYWVPTVYHQKYSGNNSRKKEGKEPKQKQHPVVDVTGDRSKVRCCKEQYCIGTWNVRPMNQGKFSSVQFSSVAQLCPTLCDPMNCSTPGLPVHHQLPVFNQTHVHRVSDAIQPSHPLSSPSPPAPNSSQHQSLFQLVNSSHEMAKVLEFQR